MKMKILCNACEEAEARVVCCVDEAALCSACDQKVHTANKLAGKHQRVPLLCGGDGGSTTSPKCDICQEASAYFFCLEDRAVLCGNCDIAIHTANTYVSAHQRFLLTGVRVGLEPFDPVASSAKEEISSKHRTIESPSKSFPQRNPPIFSVETKGIFSEQCKESRESTKSFSGATIAGSMPDWPLDEFFGFTDFNQDFGCTENASPMGDGIRLGNCDESPLFRCANAEVDADDWPGQIHDIPWTVPEIPSPGTASGLHWLRDLQYPAVSENEFFVPDICSFEGSHSHHPASSGLKRRRRC